MDNTIEVFGNTYTVKFGQYRNGTIALELFDPINGEPQYVCTVNWEENFQGENYAKQLSFPAVVIKDYSENTGIADELEKAGIIERGGAYMAGTNGTVHVKLLTPKWQDICKSQLPKTIG